VRPFSNEAEFGPTLENAVMTALAKFSKEPANVIVFRYAGNMRQKTIVTTVEVEAFKKSFQKQNYKIQPELIYISLNRDLTTKFCVGDKLKMNPSERLQNPDPGTVIDSKITGPGEFFLIASKPAQGVAIPTRYEVLAYYKTDEKGEYGSGKMNVELLRKIQELAFKLSFLYYNWLGSYRAPATIHYANKLAEWVGKMCENGTIHLPKEVFYESNKSLFFI